MVAGFKLLRQAGQGLLQMHSLGFSHNDLKLENILVDSQGNAKVICRPSFYLGSGACHRCLCCITC